MNERSNIDEVGKDYVSQIIRLETEKKTIQADIQEVYLHAKVHGHDSKIMRRAVKRMMMTDAQHREEKELEEQTDMFMHAIGEA